MRRNLRLIGGLLVIALAMGAPAHACGRQRWAAKVLADASVLQLPPANVSIEALRSLPRPDDVDGFDAPRDAVERKTYRVRAELLGDKLEQDGDIHLILAQPGNRAQTMVAEIPDPNCMQGASRAYINDVAQARLAFVKSYGIPPVTHFRLQYAPITVTGALFFDFGHGQSGASPENAELHPVLAISSSTAPSPRAQPGTGTTCAGDIRVWVNTRSGVYHLPGSRWYGRTRQGMFLCRRDADARGYRAAENGD